MVWYGMVWYRGQTIIGSAHRFGPIFATSAEISDRQHLTNISAFLTDVKFLSFAVEFKIQLCFQRKTKLKLLLTISLFCTFQNS